MTRAKLQKTPTVAGNLFQNELEVRIGSEAKPLGRGPLYKLRSVVRHHGNNVRFGHYTTFTRGNFDLLAVPIPADESRWFCHDDEKVTEVDEDDILSRETQEITYMVVYELVEGSDDVEENMAR